MIGAPPRATPCPALATVEGVDFELDLRESLHRAVYLDLFSIELRRLILPLLRRGDTVVDIGANFGFWSLIAARRGCEVVAVEPVARTRQLLIENARRNRLDDRVEVVAEAVSDSRGVLTLALPDGESGQASAHPDPALAAESLTVATTTLDELLGARRVRFLKIDVEGHEPAVLRGGTRVLSSGQVDYVLLELTSALLARTDKSITEVADSLIGHGYLFVRFVRANEGLPPRPRPLTFEELRSGTHAGDALWVHGAASQTAPTGFAQPRSPGS